MAKFKIGDKVEILDGSKIPNYTGGFNCQMSEYIGEIHTILGIKGFDNKRYGYFLDNTAYVYDERGLKLVTDHNEKIVITTDGKTTTATKYDGKAVTKTTTAKCNPDDKFHFDIGAKIAFDRLMADTIGFDWDAFKRYEIVVKVTKNNWRDFVDEAYSRGLMFEGNLENPFDFITDKFFRIIAADKIKLSPDEIYITFERDNLRICHFEFPDKTVFVW